MDVPTRLGPLNVRVTGAGPVAVLWHSLFVDSTTWREVEGPLAGERRLVLVDGPGHGPNPPPARRFTLDDCAGAAADVLDHLGVADPVDWVGNAWGGHVGLRFAATRPARCRSVAAIGTPVHALGAADRRRSRLLVALYRLFGAGPVVGLLTKALVGSDAHAAEVVGAAFRRAGRRGMVTAIESISLRRPDLTPELPSIGVPTLLSTGQNDPMWTVADARAAAALLPRGALVVLPGAGHVGPLFAAPAEVVELLRAFWRQPDEVVARASSPSTNAWRPST
ncbi:MULTISPECIES: alpha/beta fold hydrolase [unclassified Saccharothrix]|uniref:alpha/beta fold hydrolase n=1 Tax=unclassified Saccharothrix TaxID=2593673 RepID=UPI00307D45B0